MTKKQTSLRAAVATALAPLCLGLPVGAAHAQSAPTAAALEEIVVTARKREETLQTVPLSIAAFSAETIESAGINTMDDIAALTPGFTMAPLFGGGAQTPVIRGQSTTIGEPNVGFFVDGVYQASRGLMDAMLGDSVSRVEVVKGPQSALYGRNTFAGAVNIVTSRPSDELGGMIEARYGDYDTQELRGSVSGPITDWLGFRLGGTYASSDGYYTNDLNGNNLDDRSTGVLAGSLEASPTEDLDIRLRVAYSDTSDGDDPIRYVANNIELFSPAGPSFPAVYQLYGGEMHAFDKYSVTPGHQDREVTQTSLSIDWSVGDYTLTSITGYNDLSYDNAVDTDYSALSVNYATTLQDITEFSQELRITSPGDQRLTWLGGAYYYDSQTDTHLESLYGADALSIAAAVPASLRRFLVGGLINDLVEETNSFAIFGQIGFNITERWSVSAEGRWTDETKKIHSVDQSQLTGLVTGTFVDEADFQNFVPRFTVDYKMSDDVLLYASAAEGVKVGGFNVVTVAGAILPEERTYDPESAWNYEIGAKTAWADGRLTLNAAAYYIDWTDQIVRALGQTGALLNVNAGKTSVQGIELEARARPFDGLTLDAGIAYTDSSYDDYTFGTLAAIGVDPVLDGTRLQYVSEWQGFISGQYTYPVSATLDWVSRADLSYQSDQSAVQTADAYVGDATNLNLRTGFDWDRYSVRLWVENLTDEDAALVGTFTPNPGRRFDFVKGAIGAGPRDGLELFGGIVTARQPRTVGITASVRF
ncbi:MAG: TonB-dependent receptor [Steroidobacteraceae bacterium]